MLHSRYVAHSLSCHQHRCSVCSTVPWCQHRTRTYRHCIYPHLAIQLKVVPHKRTRQQPVVDFMECIEASLQTFELGIPFWVLTDVGSVRSGRGATVKTKLRNTTRYPPPNNSFIIAVAKRDSIWWHTSGYRFQRHSVDSASTTCAHCVHALSTLLCGR